MGRVFGLLLLVGALWVGLEIFNEGMDGAFGGVFARGADAGAAESTSAARRAGDAVERAHERSHDRLERALEESAPD